MHPTVLFVATERNQVVDVGYVITIGLGELAIIPDETGDTSSIAVDRLVELVQFSRSQQQFIFPSQCACSDFSEQCAPTIGSKLLVQSLEQLCPL